MASKQDPNFEARILKWLETVLETELPAKGDMWASLKNGILLCKLVNKIKPGKKNFFFFSHSSFFFFFAKQKSNEKKEQLNV